MGIRSHAKGTFHSFVESGKELSTAKMHKVAADKFILNITFAWEHAVAITDENDAGKLVSHRFPQFTFGYQMKPYFFKYLILDKKFREHLQLSSPGGAGRNRVLKISDMLKYKIKLPGIEEQIKIGQYFDNLDNLITFHHRKSNLFNKTCINAWEQRKLGDYSNLITKGTTPSSFCDTGNVTFVKIEAIRDKKIVKELCTFITKEVHEGELVRSILKENDIVFAIAGATVGKCAVITRDILPANTNQALAIIRLKSNVDRDFMYVSLTSRGMQIYINQSKSVGAQPNISLTQMNNFEFLCPSQKGEQNKIGQYFSLLDHLITLHQRKCDQLQLIRKYMLKNMFL